VKSWPTWGCEASTFPWSYSENETCYVLEGRVIVTPDGEGHSLNDLKAMASNTVSETLLSWRDQWRAARGGGGRGAQSSKEGADNSMGGMRAKRAGFTGLT